MLAIATGLVAGALHVVAGPDHLAAIAPLAVEGRKSAWREGLRWGLGHSAGVAAVALLGFALRDLLPIDAFSAWSERLVGVTLVAIGLWGLRRAVAGRIHAHRHRHAAIEHEHIHVHLAKPGDALEHRATPHVHTHAAFAIGSLHGLAGSAHFLAVLPALALPTASDAAQYVGAFALGTMIAMSSFSSAIGWCAARLADRGARAVQHLLGVCSAAAIAVGAWWLAQ